MIGRAATVSAVLAESFLFYAISELVAASYSDYVGTMPAISFVLIGLTSYFLPSLVSYFNLRGKPAFVVFALAAYVVVYGALRLEFAGDFRLWDESWIVSFISNENTGRDLTGPVFMTSLLVAATWARASHRANSEMDLETMPRTLAAGFAIATAFVVFGAPTDRAGEVARGAAGFYAFAVLALATSQLALSGATIGEARAGSITGVLIGGIVGVTAGAVLLFGLVFGVIGPIIGPPLSQAIGFIFAAILTPPAWLITKILEFLLGGSTFPAINLDSMRMAAETAEEQNADPTTAERTLAFGGRSLALLLFLLIIGGPLLLFWMFQRKRGVQRPVDSSTGSTGSLMEDLRSLLGGFGRKRSARPDRSADPVGKLYRAVLDEAEHEGRPRDPAETPAEFAPVLAGQFHAGVTDEITNVFVDARYAGREISPAEIERLEAEWREQKKQKGKS